MNRHFKAVTVWLYYEILQ